MGKPDEKGWHPLRTVFQAVSLFDELHIQPAEEDSLMIDASWVPAENSVTKTWDLLKDWGLGGSYAIWLKKRIPPESGLAGGSTDAAGLLRFARYHQGFEDELLSNIAIQIGADVPFFLVGGRAIGEGYGEEITPLPDDQPRELVLARPGVGCPTPAMYKALDDLDYEWRELPEEFETYNDFERVAPAECLELIENMQELGASHAGLTGSGSCVFGVFPTAAKAAKAASELEESGYRFVKRCNPLAREASLKIHASRSRE